MNFLLRCDICGAQAWGSGTYDSETNAADVDDISDEWADNPKLDYLLIEWCNHGEYSIIDQEEPEPLWDDWL